MITFLSVHFKYYSQAIPCESESRFELFRDRYIHTYTFISVWAI